MPEMLFGEMVFKTSKSRSGSDSDLVEFEGEITNSNIDSHYERMGVKAMRSFGIKLATPRSIKVLAEHNHSAVIGRSLSGRYDSSEKRVTSRFYIQRDISLRPGFNDGGYSNTNDYISMAEKGTMSDLSIGATVDKETCDHCGAEMKQYSFFGMRFVEDENGHYPGQTIYVDRKGKEYDKPKANLTKVVITATIEEAELHEFSLVGFGAVPDAEIQAALKQKWERGELEPKHLQQMSDRYMIKSGKSGLIFPVEGNSLRRRSMVNVPKSIGGRNVDKDIERLEQQLADQRDLNAQTMATLEEVREERNQFAAKADEFDALQNSHDDLLKEMGEMEAEVKELKAKLTDVNEEAWMARDYKRLMADEVEKTILEFTRHRGEDLRDGEIDMERAKLERMRDYAMIKQWHDFYRESNNKRLREGRGPNSSQARGYDDVFDGKGEGTYVEPYV